ncbi:conserved protein of unknown function [Rhodovastum atsumiense]|uniref:Uncharacterized protein n=1 Tax=Rhodovastum atsumiense TaxID=504468 RepID=A0A5M6IP65_9PROT|nr:hypothetical protein [Rhodovastum atsumiense]KAA5610056.1 hypothetical protein F1189_21375 [Rhodovastum atsumiense]CAH2602947.1 conserved protein of unknown function [Rhodovastum atsumiense]
MSMPRCAASNPDPGEWIPYAWIEAVDQDWIFIATEENVACFRREELPCGWGTCFRAPSGNLILAQEIDSRGSPADTCLDEVNQLDWPLADAPARAQAMMQLLRASPARVRERRSAATTTARASRRAEPAAQALLRVAPQAAPPVT